MGLLVSLHDSKIAPLRKSLSQSMAVLECKQAEYNQHILQLQSWETRLRLALQNGDENLASENLIHKQKYASLTETLKSELDLQLIRVDTLKKSLTAIEDEISKIEGETSKIRCNMSELRLLRTHPIPRQNDVKSEVDHELELIRCQIQSGALPSSGSPKPSDAAEPEAFPRQIG